MAALSNFIDQWGVLLSVGGLIIFMAYIMWDLAIKSKAGKFGTFIIFLALGLGVLGFVIKIAVQFALESGTG